MIPIDLKGKVAFVTGVADDVGFGWHIATALQAAGADIILGVHPRVLGIVERIMTRPQNAESRVLPFGAGQFAPKALLPCDVSIDTAADITAVQKETKGYDGDVSIAGCVEKVKALTPHVDIVIHCVAFSPEIAKTHLETSRGAYLTAMSVSSYSLVSMARAFLPLMKGRNGSFIGLSYLAGERAVPYYGGGMASAKAALESDARMLAWFVGEEGHRVNIISAGPYASRAAKAVGDIQTMAEEVAKRSPMRRPIEAEDVGNAAVLLCSDLARNITGECVHVDAGFHAMGG
ncbi:MAG TPA: SDR family oxidoreductase [Myxococcota bacterium]